MSKRSPLVRSLPCVACRWDEQEQPNASTEHHFNAFQLAGKKRLGDDQSASLCQWHHLATLLPGMSTEAMREQYGPSLAAHKKSFRLRYGTDQHLLELTNELLQKL